MKTATQIVFANDEQVVGEAYKQVVDILNQQGYDAFLNHIKQRYPETKWNQLFITYEGEAE